EFWLDLDQVNRARTAQTPKLTVRVRFPSPAPIIEAQAGSICVVPLGKLLSFEPDSGQEFPEGGAVGALATGPRRVLRCEHAGCPIVVGSSRGSILLIQRRRVSRAHFLGSHCPARRHRV